MAVKMVIHFHISLRGVKAVKRGYAEQQSDSLWLAFSSYHLKDSVCLRGTVALLKYYTAPEGHVRFSVSQQRKDKLSASY